MEELNGAITRQREALILCPPGHPSRASALTDLAVDIIDRFCQMDADSRLDDLEEAINYFRESLLLRPPGNPDRVISFNNLAGALFTRFQRTGMVEDLDEAITSLRQSTTLLPPEHPNFPSHIDNLTKVICERFQLLGRMEDLDEAIQYLHQSLTLCPPGHPDHLTSLNKLATTILIRFRHSHIAEDLDDVITYFRQVLMFLPPSTPDRFNALSNYATAVMTRYQQTSKMADLEEVIVYLRESIAFHPPGHPNHIVPLNNLANAILKRFHETARIDDIEESMSFYRQLLILCPLGDPNRSIALNNLAGAIFTRFTQTHAVKDLEETIMYNCEALTLRPRGNPDRPVTLGNLAVAFLKKFEQTGRMDDLEEAITFDRDTLVLRPPGDPNRSLALNNLAQTIFTRFAFTGKVEDLEEVIALNREALVLRPPGNPYRPSSLRNLADAIVARFQQTDRREDLEEAIACCRQAVELPPGHPELPFSWNRLGSIIVTHYEETCSLEDIEEAIACHRESLLLLPPGHPDTPIFLNCLAQVILTRFELTSSMEDLEEVVACNRRALVLRPLGNPGRSSSLNDLAVSVLTRFKQTNCMEDLEEGIRYHREAVALRPTGKLSQCFSLYNLANALCTRFEKTGRREDLDEAARLLSDTENAMPTEYPAQTTLKLALAGIHLKHHRLDPTGQHMSIAFTLGEGSANHPTGNPRSRFIAALQWATTARELKHESTLRAYSASLVLLNRILLATPNVESQQRILAFTDTIPKSLACNAASAAIEAGQLETAVEFLDQGRTLLWSKLRGYRHPIDLLRSVARELADTFERLSGNIERLAMTSEADSTKPRRGSERDIDVSQVPFEVNQRQYRILAEEWEEVVGRIRQVEGFTNFLKAVPFNTLRKAAVEGPVIVVNISDYRSDAIIVRDVDPPVLVPLPNAWPVDIARLSSQFKDPRASSTANFSQKLGPILRKLWDMIVCPVTEQLTELGVAENSRIWWCPTSDLCGLPLHAAGPYVRNQRCLPDLYVSSYTSTLSALTTARSGIIDKIAVPSLLVVAQPGESLPTVEEELRRILQLGNFVKALVGQDGNRDTVISSLREHSWVHFACHGYRDPQPFHSSFQLHADQRLQLIDLIKARTPNAQHAFLSACHAAAADIQGAPDEVIHLASALQFCGFRSVVGTLWAMADIDGPDVAGDFYRYMFRQPGNVADIRDSATALNFATRAMRQRNGMTLGRWVNFIHIGA